MYFCNSCYLIYKKILLLKDVQMTIECSTKPLKGGDIAAKDRLKTPNAAEWRLKVTLQQNAG